MPIKNQYNPFHRIHPERMLATRKTTSKRLVLGFQKERHDPSPLSGSPNLPPPPHILCLHQYCRLYLCCSLFHMQKGPLDLFASWCQSHWHRYLLHSPLRPGSPYSNLHTLYGSSYPPSYFYEVHHFLLES